MMGALHGCNVCIPTEMYADDCSALANMLLNASKFLHQPTYWVAVASKAASSCMAKLVFPNWFQYEISYPLNLVLPFSCSAILENPCRCLCGHVSSTAEIQQVQAPECQGCDHD